MCVFIYLILSSVMELNWKVLDSEGVKVFAILWEDFLLDEAEMVKEKLALLAVAIPSSTPF